ncbi:hypothetical protein O6H91_04G045000 [Diphasiastrum complanatum]|uniref:Uncharacterized protein n=1 Tax=Diphasiastrum complanatum TaxID=34168 RepID=A0ACC2DW84_DIPCM|nr:hypothetical protein O6H91_04G045000 [Diphasiastrum complanatum]
MWNQNVCFSINLALKLCLLAFLLPPPACILAYYKPFDQRAKIGDCIPHRCIKLSLET